MGGGYTHGICTRNAVFDKFHLVTIKAIFTGSPSAPGKARKCSLTHLRSFLHMVKVLKQSTAHGDNAGKSQELKTTPLTLDFILLESHP